MVSVYILIVINLLGGQPSQTVMQSSGTCSTAASSINAGGAAKAYCVQGQV